MAQFTLYRNTNQQTQGRYPFLLDVQNDFLDALKTRLVVPAINLSGQKAITHLNPVFEYEQQQYLLVVQEMAAIPATNLGAKVTELAALRSEILAAVDLLITGI
ncbi:CcdB family protein [Methylomonas sp. EFPC3]|uniref:CcdB family protein n=1 Tax=Methylomonas sp. EFPC3 TaxID=3021710 RepID=UPI002417E421|nr:CcdB family protein [Methylomonas sp. EFPC3]WFP50433.1 CcdB family protein [Methylomonas sp. EFPC3]